MAAAKVRACMPKLFRRLGRTSTVSEQTGSIAFNFPVGPLNRYVKNVNGNIITIKSSSDKNNHESTFPKITLGVACMASLTGVCGGDVNDCSDDEVEEDIDGINNDPEIVVESSDDGDANDNNNPFLENEDNLGNHKLEVIEGDKEGSKWLVLDEVYILHKYRTTGDEIFWECSGRRAFNCPFKAATAFKDEKEDDHELVFMYKVDTHDCGQTKLGPIMQKFRNRLKTKMRENFKNKFHNVFADEKKALLIRYKDNPDLLERIVYELKEKRIYRVCAQRARARKFPKNPTCGEEMDLDLIGLKRFELGRSSHFDCDIKGKEIILLGTPLTVKAWAQAEFKSGDGTFKICPKQFYQVNRLCLCQQLLNIKLFRPLF